MKTMDKVASGLFLSIVAGAGIGVGVNSYMQAPPTPVVVDQVVITTPPPPVYATPQSDDDYLCEVYHRTPVKKDGSGDFTWKDKEAAKRAGMDLCAYVIGGLNLDFKKKLVVFGHAADDKKIAWSLLSAFRDDYRQRIASGTKAREKNSMHGGSRATKGYGDGRAADVTVADGPISSLFTLIDDFGKSIGITRPYKFDPNHVQMGSRPARKVKTRKSKTGDRYDSFDYARSKRDASSSPPGGHK